MVCPSTKKRKDKDHLRINVLTLFPEVFNPVFSTSIIGRAVADGRVSLDVHNIRDYAIDRHGTVDDTPYGGGAGMILKPEPIAAAINDINAQFGNAPVIFLTPQGEPFQQKIAVELSLLEHFILLCGHYRGIDERIRIRYIDREVSLGDFVLSGGEIAAMVVVDAVVRLIPGVLGDFESGLEDSFVRIAGPSSGDAEGRVLLDGPWYTRPPEFEGMRVPEVLLSGNHEEIAGWREKMAMKRTLDRRPDLVRKDFSTDRP